MERELFPKFSRGEPVSTFMLALNVWLPAQALLAHQSTAGKPARPILWPTCRPGRGVWRPTPPVRASEVGRRRAEVEAERRNGKKRGGGRESGKMNACGRAGAVPTRCGRGQVSDDEKSSSAGPTKQVGQVSDDQKS